MPTNNSQISNSPSAPSFDNDTSQSIIDQLLSNEIVRTSQSLIQFNETNMIPSQIPPSIPLIQERDENLTSGYEGCRGRRRRRRQLDEEQLQKEMRRIHRRNLQEQREEQPRPTHQLELRRQQLAERARIYDISYEQNRTDEIFHQHIGERLVETYDSERTPANNRWEQEQLEQLEGFVILEQLTLFQDEIEQSNKIDACQRLIEEQMKERNIEELNQLETWEQEAFLAQQQLHQN